MTLPHQELIERYAAGADQLSVGIAGLTRDDLLALPIPGTWSIQQIVVHTVESDIIYTTRMKWVIAEENPPIIGFDENAWAAKLFYDQTDIQHASELFRINRLLTAQILRHLPAEAFTRTGTHSEYGPQKLWDMVKNITNHLEHHLGFLRKKRELLGKPLA